MISRYVYNRQNKIRFNCLEKDKKADKNSIPALHWSINYYYLNIIYILLVGNLVTKQSGEKMTKLFLQAINGQKTKKVPFWFMRQAGRYLPEYMALRKDAGSFLDMAYNPDFAIEVTLQPIRRFDMDAAILFSDILTIPHALGQHLEFITGKGPQLDPIRSAKDLNKLKFDPLKFHSHLKPVYQTVSGLASALADDKTLIGFSGAPWTVATYMVEGGSSKDFKYTKSFAASDPEGFQNMMDMLVDATAEYLIHQINYGAECVQIFDSWAGVLNEPMFEKWVIAPTKRLIERVRAVHPHTPIIGFPKGAGLMYRHYADQTGITAIAFDQSLPLNYVRDELQSKMCVQGALDNGLLLAGGKPMLEEAERIIDALKGGPFVFNLGHGVIKETPPEHVAELSAYLKSVEL